MTQPETQPSQGAEGSSAVAVIPARGGSKRIPRKNIRMMSGQPLIGWAIQAALESQAFDQVVVSTDDPEIAAVAVDFGATVPFVRPVELSDDFTGTVPVIAHAIAELARQGHGFELVCCIYPAAIFVSPQDIAQSGRLLAESGTARYVSTVARYAVPIQEAMEIDEQGRIRVLHPEHLQMRTQDYPERWHDAGQLYWGRTEAWTELVPVFESAVGYPLAAWRVQDIDSEEDWKRAELIHELILAEAQP
ncbi:MAG: pseudaminic acid cytidylyltransferase [Actinomycetes bacterium]